MKNINKEKILEIFIYALIFCVFMGSNFLKFNICGINFNIARVMMIISALIFFISAMKDIIHKNYNVINIKNKQIKFCVIFFIIWSIFSIISIYKVLDIKMYLITNFFLCIGTINILFFLKHVNFEEKKDMIFNMIVIPILINCIYYLYLYFIKNENIGGLYHNSNDLATVLLLSIPISVYLLFRTNKKTHKFFYIVTLYIYIFSFANITSRAAILGVLFAMFFMGIILLIKKRNLINSNIKIKILIIILAIIFLILAINISKYYIGKIDFKPIENAKTSNQVRSNLIHNGIYFLKQDLNIIFGIGTGNSIYYLENFSIYSTNNIYNFHNFWLNILVEYGMIVLIVFFIMYIFIIIELYKKYIKNKKTSLIFLLFLIAFIVASISSSTILTREWLWLTFAIIITYVNHIELKEGK